jgi:glycosyltransferase involved in cell wall biosynthesis
MFPEFTKKIVRVNFSVNEQKFKISKKSNFITYMPRKLPDHADLLIFYLKNLLPKSWKIVPLINISEKKLVTYLSKSKIFLSFSNLEGIGIPPIEAALAGNKVIGYTGGGGIEYWKSPIFKKIEPGEIDDFGQILLKEIKNYKLSWIKKSKKYRKQLSKQYSEQNQTKSLINLIKIIKKIYI